VEAYALADEENTAAMRDWAMFLYNAMPGGAWKTEENLEEWHTRGGMSGRAR
jgi:hypothetical protein